MKPELGKHIKVQLPGERPWAEVIAIYEDGTFDGRIDNDLVGSMSESERQTLAEHFFPGQVETLLSLHNFKYNDIVRFRYTNVFDDTWSWIPTETVRGTA